jgi:hypothetical protein
MSEPVSPGLDEPDNDRAVSWAQRYEPRASVRAQLYAAAVTWLLAASMLLVRAFGFLGDQHKAWWIVAAAVSVAAVLGLVKGRAVMYRASKKSVARIRARGRSCFFGYFSWKTWLLVAFMMTAGILLRRSGLPHTLLGVVYLAIAVGLVYGDWVFWDAAIRHADPVPA